MSSENQEFDWEEEKTRFVEQFNKLNDFSDDQVLENGQVVDDDTRFLPIMIRDPDVLPETPDQEKFFGEVEGPTRLLTSDGEMTDDYDVRIIHPDDVEYELSTAAEELLGGD